jgi:predicted ester cyclase
MSARRFETAGPVITAECELFTPFGRYLDNLNSHDPDRVKQMFTKSVVFEDSAWPTVMHGPDEVREMLVSRWRSFPDLRFDVVEGPYLSEDRGHLAVKLELTGTMTGPLKPPGFDPTDRGVRIHVAGFYDFRGERVSRGRVIFDSAYLGEQMAALPGPGGIGEQVAVIFQRLSAWRIRNIGR